MFATRAPAGEKPTVKVSAFTHIFTLRLSAPGCLFALGLLSFPPLFPLVFALPFAGTDPGSGLLAGKSLLRGVLW